MAGRPIFWIAGLALTTTGAPAAAQDSLPGDPALCVPLPLFLEASAEDDEDDAPDYPYPDSLPDGLTAPDLDDTPGIVPTLPPDPSGCAGIYVAPFDRWGEAGADDAAPAFAEPVPFDMV